MDAGDRVDAASRRKLAELFAEVRDERAVN
jgi:hypothetical protein